MFKIKDQYILRGSSVDVNWELEPKLRFLFLWYPVSWLPWKNFTPISSKGTIVLCVNEKQLVIKIKQLHFWGFKTLCSINRKVHVIEVINNESKLSLIENATLINHRNHAAEIASLFFNIKGRSMHAKQLTLNQKTKTPTIKNILPIQ